MSNPEPNLFSKISSQMLDWIKLSPKYLFAIALFSELLLFSPLWILERAGWLEFVTKFRPWIGLIFMLTSTLLFTHFSVFVFEESLRPFYKKQKEKKRLRIWLQHLTHKQKEMLKEFINENTRTVSFNFMDGEVKELVTANILYLSTGLVDRGNYTPHTINSWVWEHLHKHPEILSRDKDDD